MASEETGVKYDNSPAVEEAGEVQALEAAEHVQRPQL